MTRRHRIHHNPRLVHADYEARFGRQREAAIRKRLWGAKVAALSLLILGLIVALLQSIHWSHR